MASYFWAISAAFILSMWGVRTKSTLMPSRIRHIYHEWKADFGGVWQATIKQIISNSFKLKMDL